MGNIVKILEAIRGLLDLDNSNMAPYGRTFGMDNWEPYVTYGTSLMGTTTEYRDMFNKTFKHLSDTEFNKRVIGLHMAYNLCELIRDNMLQQQGKPFDGGVNQDSLQIISKNISTDVYHGNGIVYDVRIDRDTFSDLLEEFTDLTDIERFEDKIYTTANIRGEATKIKLVGVLPKGSIVYLHDETYYKVPLHTFLEYIHKHAVNTGSKELAKDTFTLLFLFINTHVATSLQSFRLAMFNVRGPVKSTPLTRYNPATLLDIVTVTMSDINKILNRVV